jgi:hypothetical protein
MTDIAVHSRSDGRVLRVPREQSRIAVRAWGTSPTAFLNSLMAATSGASPRRVERLWEECPR